ncbi:dipeptidase [Kribbella endophytica]
MTSSLHDRLTVVDTHDDLLMLCARRPVDQQAAYFRQNWLPQLRAGGVDLQVLPVFVDDDFRPEGALRQTLRMLETGWRIAAGNSDAVRVCLTGDEVEAALADGLLAIVLALEGCEAVGTDVELFEPLFQLGVRIASLTHLGRNMLADGSGEDRTGSRLTGAGIDAVAACESLGIMLDVSHLGASSTDHLLEVATRPVIASHSSAYAVRPHHRNLTDDRLRGIAGSGGTVGINLLATFVDRDEHTVARAVDHIEHVASVVGVEHVGLGPDFVKEVFDEIHGPGQEVVLDDIVASTYIPGLEGPAGLPLITGELVNRGWPEDQIRWVMGDSFRRVLGRELGVPGSSAVRRTA